ncbi:MAG: hypothetical protein JXB00_15080 [Bacteroidales bacterium]|nr:hypothetical protein [Bacteroidales bacterium]
MLIKVSKDIVIFEKSEFHTIEGTSIWFHGYFFVNDTPYTYKTAADYIYTAYKDNKLKEVISWCNGVFSIVILDENEKNIIVANDRYGFDQLFYTSGKGMFIIGTNIWEVASNLEKPKINIAAARELALFRYVLSGHTLINNISEILPASIYRFNYSDNEIKESRAEYWQFSYQPGVYTLNNAIETVEDTLLKIIGKFQKGLFQGKNIGINHTGGIDSRYILGLVLKNGFPKENIQLHTFGDRQSEDITIVRALADKAGIGFNACIFDDPFFDFYRKESVEESTSELGFTCAYYQAYGAIKISEQYKGIDYLLTGSDGFFVGLMTNKTLFSLSNIEELTDYIYFKNRPILQPSKYNEIFSDRIIPDEAELKSRIYSNLKTYYTDNISSFFNWTLRNRLRKYIMSINKLLDKNTFLLLPYYDYDFVDLMAHLPEEALFGQYAYINAMYRLNFSNELEKFRYIPVEKRTIKMQNEEFSIHLNHLTIFQKVIKKLFVLPDKNDTYTMFKTFRYHFPEVMNLIKPLLYSDSELINSAKIPKFLYKHRRREYFIKHGMPAILTVLQAEHIIKTLQTN